MAFPQVLSITQTTFASDATSHAVSMPATVNAGDLLLALLSFDGSPGITTPTGWTFIVGHEIAGTRKQAVYAKVASGSEDGTTVNFVTDAAETCAAQVYKITDWYGSIADGIAAGSPVSSGGTTTPDPPTITPAWGALDTLWLAILTTSADIAVNAYPASYTNGTFTTSGTGTTHAQMASARRAVNASSEDPGTFTLNNTVGCSANTLAIRPAVPSIILEEFEEEEEYGDFTLISGTFRWSIDHIEARTDYGYPTVYVEVNSTAMPSGVFPAGEFFERRLLDLPRLEEAELDSRFGISGFQRVTLTIDNSDGLISSLDLQDAYVRLFLVDEGGGTREFKGRVTEWTLSHRCVVTVEDVDAIAVTQELPRRTLNDLIEAEKEADAGFEDTVVADDLGSPIPVIFGRAVKLPLLYVKADEADREYDYIIGEGEGLNGGNFEGIFTVYREDQALDDTERFAQSGSSAAMLKLHPDDQRPDSWYKYWWVEITAGPGIGNMRHVINYNSSTNVITPDSNFTATLTTSSKYRLREWRFFDGSQSSPYAGYAFLRFKKRLGVSGNTDAIYADVNGLGAETNPVRAVQSLLTNEVWGLGLEVDTDSFDDAVGLPIMNDLLCEGAISEITTITDILNGSGDSQGLLSFRDMVLSKSDEIRITVDQVKAAAHHFGLGDETGLNNILTVSPEVVHVHPNEKVKNLKVRYRKNIKESDAYQHELTRPSSTNGVDRVVTLPFVYDHETADRWLDYKRKRFAAAVRRLALDTGQEGGSLRRGERASVSIPSLGLEGSSWEITGCSVTPAGANSLSLVPYSAAPYAYVPITDEGGTLPVDESFDIPADFTKTPPDPVSGASVSYANDLNSEGRREVFAIVTFTPPGENYDHSRVSVRKNGATNWDSAGSGYNRVRIKVVPGLFMDYQIVPYNVHGLPGLVTTVISNQLVLGDTTAPATPTGLIGTVKLNMAEWVWNKNMEADLAGYEYEISLTSGAVVKTGFTTDNSLTYKLTDKVWEDSIPPANRFLTTTSTRRLRVRAIDHTAKATGASGNKSAYTGFVTLTSGDVQRLDARDGDFSRQWSNARLDDIPIGSTVVVVQVTGVQAIGGKDLFVDASFTVQATGGASGPLVHAGYAVRRNSAPLPAGALSASGVGRGTGTPRKGTAAVTIVDSEVPAGTYTYDIQVFGVGSSGVDCQVDAANISVAEGRR